MSLREKEKEIDRFLNNLNNKVDRLWPYPEPGNGNGHGHRDGNYDDDAIDELTRQLSLKYEGKELFLHAAEIVGPDRLASWWYQQVKEQYIFHKSSYCKRGLNAYDGQGCYATGCIPECEFYPAEGKLYYR